MRGTIWGRNIKRARPIFWEIINNYKYVNIQPVKIRDNAHCCQVIFENGDIWTAVRASESQRGRRSNISLVDYSIDDEIINLVIRPATSALPYGVLDYFWVEEDNNIEEKFI